jgi:hypothetical protein
MINWALAGNPANWIVVFLMLAIGVMGVTLISKQFGFVSS